MRRLARSLLNALTVLSLLVCVATSAMWVRAQMVMDWLSWSPVNPESLFIVDQHAHHVVNRRGYIEVAEDKFFRAAHPPRGFVWERSQRPDGDLLVAPGIVLDPEYDPAKRWLVVIPHWLLLAGSLVLPIVTVNRWRTSRPPSAPLAPCRRCSYDLTGNVSGVCPECGMTISST